MALEFRRITPDLADPFGDFLEALDAESTSHFRPHPLTRAEAERIAAYDGADEYYLLLGDGVALGYGLLRGWDEGYAVPSLGIAIAPTARGQDFARLLMGLLHAAARLRGAARIRLRASPENERAMRLYAELGYVFGELERGQRVGLLEL